MPTLLLRVAITAATKNTMYMFISRMQPRRMSGMEKKFISRMGRIVMKL